MFCQHIFFLTLPHLLFFYCLQSHFTFFLAVQFSLWDLSSPTRDRTPRQLNWPSAVKVQSPTHWTARDSLISLYLFLKYFFICWAVLGLRCGMWDLSSGSLGSGVSVRGLRCHVWDLSFLIRDQTRVSCIERQILNHWTAREVSIVSFKNCLQECQSRFWSRAQR